MVGGSVGKWYVVGGSVGRWSVGRWLVVLIKSAVNSKVCSL